MNRKNIIRLGGISGCLAVGLGAFGAHALKDLLADGHMTATWETASRYHLIHSVAMLLPWSMPEARLKPALFFLLGILAFSGSLYVMALTGLKMLGMVTPLGGVLFIAGWLILAFQTNNVEASPL